MKTVSDYYELGRIVHFIADYFTFPHSPDFTGTLKQHVEYESLFHKYIEAINGIDYNKSINDVKCKASCVSMIESAHEKYLGMKHNFQTDWQFISSVCIEVTDAVTSRNSISAKKQVFITAALRFYMKYNSPLNYEKPQKFCGFLFY